MINSKKPVKPSRLNPGDTIGIVAPAGPFDRGKFLKGKAVLESAGFRTFFDETIFRKHGFLAGNDVQRADQVNRLFADPSIQAVICARGGYGSMRMLPFLDVETIRKHPKIFFGFSDISALLSVIQDWCGLIPFHGPVVTTLANAPEETITSLLTILTSEKTLELTPENGIIIKPGVASGRMAGGNLTTLCHLVGTPYAPFFNGNILLLEDIGEAPYRIDRMLTQMKLAGCFNGISGLVLGSFKDCGPSNEIFNVVRCIFEDTDVPILAGFDIGHGKRNFTIPLGLSATLNADGKQLSFHEPATAA